MSKYPLLPFILCFFLIHGCNSTDQKKGTTKEEARPKSFSEASLLDITPLADGGAYANDLGGGLWYLKGGEAVKVSEASFLVITPLADGGAYANDLGGGLWYLKGGEVVNMKEVNQISPQTTSLLSTKRERALWALLQHERSKRKGAEEERDNLYAERPENNESENDDWPGR